MNGVDRALKEKFLEKFPAFGRMPDGLVDELLSSARRQVIPAGRHVYSEGDFCQMFTFLVSGEVRVYKSGVNGREITLYERNAGETCIINASCILSGIPAPANAVTQTECDALLLPAPVFRGLMERYEEVREYVFTVLAKNLANMMALVEEVAFEHIDERLLDYLAEKAEDSVLYSTHQKVANDLGTSREVISRLLKEFERKGMLALSRNSIRLTRV